MSSWHRSPYYKIDLCEEIEQIPINNFFLLLIVNLKIYLCNPVNKAIFFAYLFIQIALTQHCFQFSFGSVQQILKQHRTMPELVNSLLFLILNHNVSYRQLESKLFLFATEKTFPEFIPISFFILFTLKVKAGAAHFNGLTTFSRLSMWTFFCILSLYV